MKFLTALFFLFLSTSIDCAAKSVPAEILTTVIGDTIKSRIPNPADPKLLAGLIYDIAMGKPERFVEDSFESFKPDKIKDDAIDNTKMELLKLMVPGVAVYVETARQVFGVAETYVNDWQDWAIKNRAQEFKDEVLSKTTVKELDDTWNEYLYGGGMTYAMAVEDRMKGIFGANIKEIVGKMKEAYQQRRKELERKGKLAKILQERVAAKQRAIKHFLWMKKEAEQKTSGIMEMLEFLKLPSTKENIEKYLKNKQLYNELLGKWHSEVNKKKAAGEAVRTGDQETDAALSAGAEAQNSVAGNTKDTFTPPDYSGILREYGLNADRLLTNNVSPAEYTRLRDLLYGSADAANKACMAPYWNGLMYSSPDIKPAYESKINMCRDQFNRFAADAAEITKRLDEYGVKLKEDLEALVMNRWKDKPLEGTYAALASEFYASSQGKNLERYDNVMYSIETDNNYYESYDHWEYSREGKKNPDVKEMEKRRDAVAGIAGGYETLVPLAEEKAGAYKKKTAEYETLYKGNMTKYYDLYQQNSSMAEYYGAETYDFKKQLNQFSFAQKMLNEKFMGDGYIAQMKGRAGACRGIQEKWNEEISANKKFLADFGNTVKEFKALAVWNGKSGTMEMSKANFEKQYKARFQALLDSVSCSVEALNESREGFFNKEKAVKNGCFLPISEHRKNLNVLSELSADSQSMNFYSKRDAMYARINKMEEALKNIPVKLPSAEIEEITKEANRISREFGFFSTISHENLLGTYTAYKERISRAQEIEDNMLNFACQSSSVPENKDYMGRLPWKVSDKVEKYCLDENNKIKGGAGYGDIAPGTRGDSAVKKLYEDFKQAYESRNVSRVMSFIDENWTSQDGSEISDLEEHLSRIFRVFNEISFSISNLNVSDEGNGNYTVSYDLHMTSRIHAKNIKREEKSSVSEKARTVDGKTRIYKTENGSYWLVK